jgi:hypothetical protein
MIYLGNIIDVRDDPYKPLKVAFDLGDFALEPSWLECGFSVWTTLNLTELTKALKAGVFVQCAVWDTLYTGSDNKFRVLEVYPTGEMMLEDNSRKLARQGDPVVIKGSPKLLATNAPTILTGLPPVAPLAHNLFGRILEDTSE